MFISIGTNLNALIAFNGIYNSVIIGSLIPSKRFTRLFSGKLVRIFR